MRPRTLELRSAFLAMHALQIFSFYRRPDAGARKIQVARNLLGPPNQAPSLPRPTQHRQLAAAAVRLDNGSQVRAHLGCSRQQLPALAPQRGAQALGGVVVVVVHEPRVDERRDGLGHCAGVERARVGPREVKGAARVRVCEVAREGA